MIYDCNFRVRCVKKIPPFLTYFSSGEIFVPAANTPENMKTPHEKAKNIKALILIICLLLLSECRAEAVPSLAQASSSPDPGLYTVYCGLHQHGYGIHLSDGSSSSGTVSICGRPALNMTHHHLDHKLKVSGDNLPPHFCKTNDYQ